MLNNKRHVFVFNKTRQTFLAFRVNVADSVLSRLVGLLGRRSLQPGSGVWIVPANAVHTIGMLFSFDLVLIDKNFKVVGIRELLRPFTVTRPNFKAESVLELPAHSVFRSRTQIGDQLLIERYEARKMPEPTHSETMVEGHEIPGKVSTPTPGAQVLPIAPESSGRDSSRSKIAVVKTN